MGGDPGQLLPAVTRRIFFFLNFRPTLCYHLQSVCVFKTGKEKVSRTEREDESGRFCVSRRSVCWFFRESQSSHEAFEADDVLHCADSR